jgi:hypothetical protein
MRISFDSHESINLCLPKLKTQSTLDMRKDAPASAQAGACKADEKIYFYMNSQKNQASYHHTYFL